ncbi:hypothetical protein ACGFI3_26520 [Nonomuraea wenchangensis]|uniref:hypothetical protein n=1 Tax=Nonomuraea wenchangensis TaxID=568860 RepID=UPI0037236B23
MAVLDETVEHGYQHPFIPGAVLPQLCQAGDRGHLTHPCSASRAISDAMLM